MLNVHQRYPSFLQAAPYLAPYLGWKEGMWIFGALRWYNYCVLINILHPDSAQLGPVASLSSSYSHKFLKCHFSLLVFTMVIPPGLPSEVPRKRRNGGHGISEVAVKFGKLMILCRKKRNLDLYPIICLFCFVLFLNLRLLLNHGQLDLLCQYFIA